MLSFFITRLSAASISLIAANASSVLGNVTGPPTFLKLWAPWCQYCRSLAPVWDSLSLEPSLSITVADIECNFSDPLCRRFEGTTYPRFFWVDPRTNATIRYLGERSLDHFKLFATKQLNFPFTRFDPAILHITSSVSLFIFSLPSGNTTLHSIARSISSRFRHIESHFFIEDSDHFTFSAVTSQTARLPFNDAIDSPSLFDFILRNSVPFLAPLTGSIVSHFEHENRPFLAVVVSQPLDPADLRVAESAARHFPVVHADCTAEQWFCRYTAVVVGNVSAFVVFDRGRRGSHRPGRGGRHRSDRA
jgi:thiol-disulfide isomerase/thioredoxin